jgi:hypothetical protein
MINEQLSSDFPIKEKEMIYLDERLEFDNLNLSFIELNYFNIMNNPDVKFRVKERLFEAKRKREEEAKKLINSIEHSKPNQL